MCNFKLTYCNAYFVLKDYNYLKVYFYPTEEVVSLVWWDEIDYKTDTMIGQWRLKKLNIKK